MKQPEAEQPSNHPAFVAGPADAGSHETAFSPDKQAAFMGIAAFCRHKKGCPQLVDAVRCECGLGSAQEALMVALWPPADAASASAPAVPRETPEKG
jgi:hypothetical protein